IEKKAGDTIIDAVSQATGTACHGQRGVALGVHLAQSARLVARWHEQEVTAGKQPPGFGFIKADACGNLPGIASGKLTQFFFYGSLTTTEDGQLSAGLNDGLSDTDGQVQAFLANQPRHYGE